MNELQRKALEGPWFRGDLSDDILCRLAPNVVVAVASPPDNYDEEIWRMQIAPRLAAVPEMLRLAKLVVEYFGKEEIEPFFDADIRLRDLALGIVAQAEPQP